MRSFKKNRFQIGYVSIGKGIAVFSVLLATVSLSGCSLPNSGGSAKGPMANATVLKTTDGGVSWAPKIKVDEKKTIASVNILSLAMDPSDSNVIYIGTETNGIFVSKDGAETWSQSAFPQKVYGLVFDPQDHNVIYASGAYNGRAKIYKRTREDEQWKEVYTEPADGTVISSLAIDKTNSQILYAGTSDGVIVKTMNGGLTWENLKKMEGPVTGIVFDASGEERSFSWFFKWGYSARKTGKNIEDLTKKTDGLESISGVYSVAADPVVPGVAYLGTSDGIFRRASENDAWKPLNIIGSSKGFPIRAIAINPSNSREIIYSSAKAIYKSVDGGANWSTFQLDTAKEISVLKYDQANPSKIYAGFRKY